MIIDCTSMGEPREGEGLFFDCVIQCMFHSLFERIFCLSFKREIFTFVCAKAGEVAKAYKCTVCIIRHLLLKTVPVSKRTYLVDKKSNKPL